MLSLSVNILFYFYLVIQNAGVQIVVKVTPREGHPLKEGLRLDILTRLNTVFQPREGHPLKEGLRHFPTIPFLITIYTQRGSSTKRGIKTLTEIVFPFRTKFPREGHPLKEGLRPIHCLQTIRHLMPPQRGSSTKRGIKTNWSSFITMTFLSPERVIH